MNSLRAVAPVATSSKVLQKNDVIDELLASCSTCNSSKNEMRTIFVGEFYNYSRSRLLVTEQRLETKLATGQEVILSMRFSCRHDVYCVSTEAII